MRIDLWSQIATDGEDMWHAFNLIAVGDRLSTTTLRKVVKESSTGSVDSKKVRDRMFASVYLPRGLADHAIRCGDSAQMLSLCRHHFPLAHGDADAWLPPTPPCHLPVPVRPSPPRAAAVTATVMVRLRRRIGWTSLGV